MTRKTTCKYETYKLCDKSVKSQSIPSFALQKPLIFLVSIIILGSLPSTILGQEVLRGLTVNPELVKITQDKKKSTQLKSALATPDSIGLPFVDDFSTTTVFPDPNLWIDKQAFINNTYPINPVTVGVATLDALDENGQLYPNASSTSFSADKLTSKPFKLNFNNTPRSDFYFSFFYQAQGIGDKPETGDSLMVEFYSVDSAKWNKVWATPGDSVRPFKQVIFAVDTEYQKNGFQFRFRNLASLDSSDVAGKHGNVDQWHIDYVKLDTGRFAGDTVLHDIAFVKPPTSLLKVFQSMPWDQYLVSFQNLLKPTFDVSFRNNDTATSPTFHVAYKVKEITPDNTGNIFNGDAGSTSLPPNTTFNLNSNLRNPFDPKNIGSLMQFDVMAYLSGTNDKRHENDTVHYKQVFSNYYAYDDGSSEAGYGLIGEGTQNAMLAYQFNAYKQDTLTGISFYFNPTERDTTLNYPFTLAVWADNNGLPGRRIYSKDNDSLFSPKKVLLNQFYNFKLDSGIIVNGKFYIGFIQKSNFFLNIGFDLNNNNQNNLYINTYGVWNTSSIAGTLMVRPVFDKIQEGPVTGTKTITSQNFMVYPNPADNVIYINTGSYSTNKPLKVNIFDITGKLALSSLLHENTCDVSHLPNGIYFLQMSGDNTDFKPVKILIQR
jgi:hypothetical protein